MLPPSTRSLAPHAEHPLPVGIVRLTGLSAKCLSGSIALDMVASLGWMSHQPPNQPTSTNQMGGENMVQRSPNTPAAPVVKSRRKRSFTAGRIHQAEVWAPQQSNTVGIGGQDVDRMALTAESDQFEGQAVPGRRGHATWDPSVHTHLPLPRNRLGENMENKIIDSEPMGRSPTDRLFLRESTLCCTAA